MAGLEVPDEKYRGRFRGEAGLETTRVWIAGGEGVAPSDVAESLAAFERTLRRAVSRLDARYPIGQELDADGLAAVIDVCAWTHPSGFGFTRSRTETAERRGSGPTRF
jgi:hypothetical protein